MSMIINLVRVLFLLVVLAITISFAFQSDVYNIGSRYATWFVLLPALVAVVLILADMLWRHKRLQVISGLFFGILAGLIAAYILGLLIDLAVNLYPSPAKMANPGDPPAPRATMTAQELNAAQQKYESDLQMYRRYTAYRQTVDLVKTVAGACAVFICVTTVLQTKDSFRFVVPYVEFARQARGPKPLLLDTSVIIDGRIADIAETRIFDTQLVVPRFVLDELQTIADSGEKLRRNRGRRGLSILNRLRENERIDIQIMEAEMEVAEEHPSVDAKLVALARHLNGRIVTNDYNLNKIAALQDVDVINLNDLSNSLKPVMMPGEKMSVRIIRAGDEPGQGVGYLEDGTMVVVEQAQDNVGSDVSLVVTSTLQTSAGRMIFGRRETQNDSTT